MAVVKLKGKLKLKASLKDVAVSKPKRPKIAILTIGIPGSGKTTWAEQQSDFVNLNLDDFRAKISGDAANQDINKQAVEMRDAFLRRASNKQQNVILSDTNINPFFRQKLEEQLKQLGYSIQYKIFDIELEEAKKRNSMRQRQVPTEVIERMYNSLKEQNLNG